MMFSDDQEKDLQPNEKKTEVGVWKPPQEVWINTLLRDVPLTPACKAFGTLKASCTFPLLYDI